MDNEKRTERDDLIIGRNAVSEALKSGKLILCLWQRASVTAQ